MSNVTTEKDAHGKQKVLRGVQTSTTSYTQTEDGQWHSVTMSVQDRIDTTNDEIKTAKITCQRVGSDTVAGVAVSIYTVHGDNEGSISDNKLWMAANHLVLKSEANIRGTRYTTVYDYTHVTAPANAKPLGTP